MPIGYLTTGTSASDRIQTETTGGWTTGVIEWRGCVALADWEFGGFSSRALGHHRGQFTFRVRGGANSGDPSNLDIVWHDGTTTQTIQTGATLPDGLIAYQWVWLRFVFNVNNGANRVADFYYSLDPETTDVSSVSWTQIGSQVSAATSTIRSATSAVAGVGGDSTLTGSTPNNARYAFATLTLNGTTIHSPDLRDDDQGWSSPPATDSQAHDWAFNGAGAWQAPIPDKLVGRSVHFDFAAKQVVIESGV